MLIVALMLMVVLALGLTTYLQLNLSSARLAQRSHRQNAAFHLAEAGAEEALWAVNRAAANQPDAWSSWTVAEPAARRRLDGFDLGGNTRGDVRVHISSVKLDAIRPTILALATVQAPDDTPVTKMLQLTLGRRARFAAGLMARDAIAFAGSNATVDSWNSDPDDNPATPPVPYGAGVRNDGGSVASTSVENLAVLLNQAQVWGRVATGGGAPQVGVNGSITGRDTPVGVKVDPARVSTDFIADFPLLTAPADGELLAAVGETLGVAGTATRWRCPAITLNGNKTLTILGDVTLILTAGAGADAISVTGNASIVIPEGSSLTIYAEGDVRIAGNGIGNANAQAATFQLYGTSTSVSGQVIQLAGNGALKVAAYAPNADVRLNGNGDIMGAVVAREITLTGNAAFHYDEALADEGDDMPFGVVRWRELDTAAEREAHAAKFQGW
ncbi:MAG TPA: hypothetical protein VEB66_16680 [Opitutaceae bacterium]|nr:hypothetical protein [Opitutaceae bacterium]